MSQAKPTATEPARVGHPRVLRRRYLIDPRRQLRTTATTTTLTIVLLLVINLGFAFLRTSQSEFLAAVAPQLTPLIEEQDATFSLTMIVISAGLVIAVGLTTIVQTHRTAGAVFAVRQRLERVREGDLQVTLKLRHQDNLQDLEIPFNEMVRALRHRSLQEAATLEQLAASASVFGPDGEGIAASLAEIARHKRQLGN